MELLFESRTNLKFNSAASSSDAGVGKLNFFQRQPTIHPEPVGSR